MKKFRQYLKEGVLPDSWLKELMQDVKEGEGWCTIDYIQLMAQVDLNKDVWNKEKEIEDQVKKLGYGKLLREIKESKNLQENKKVKAMKPFRKYLSEASVDYGNRLEFDTIGGKPEPSIISSELHMGCWSSGAKVFKSKELENLLRGDDDAAYYKKKDELEEKITKDLLKAMEKFDREVESAIKKYGFNK